MSGKIIPKHAFGITANSRNCLLYAEDHHLAYVCGHTVVVLNTESRDQQFIHGSTHGYQSLGITALARSGPRKILAIAEKAEPFAAVTFYDSHTLRRRKVLQHPDIGSNEIVSIAFSDDGKYFLLQGGAPEWNLLLWNVEKTVKLLCITKVCLAEDQTVAQISFCPWDSSVVLCIGKSVGKLFRLQEGQYKPISLSLRRDHAYFVSHSWLSDDKLVIGTEGGEILLVENFEFRGIVYPTGQDNEDYVPILSLIGTSRGFIAGTIAGEIRMFEKAEDIKEQFQLAETVRLPKDDKSNIVSMALGLDDLLVCGTDTQQLFCYSLQSNNLGKTDTNVEYLISPFHQIGPQAVAGITAIDIALWKPYMVTTSKDNTVRLWNMNERKVELMKQFSEEPTSVALHPSGLYLVVGFMEKLRVMSILLDKLEQVRELSVRQCNLVKFSNGGQFIAATTGSSINIFDLYTGAIVSTLRGHSSKIRSITWLNHDARLMSVGAEGAAFYWDLFPATKRPESRVMSAVFTAGTGFMDSSRAFVCTPDKILKELMITEPVTAAATDQAVSTHDSGNHSPGGSVAGGVVGGPAVGGHDTSKEPRDLELGYFVSTMLMDETRKLLFLGTADDDLPGSVISILTTPRLGKDFEITHLHSSGITAMCLSREGNLLYTGDGDGHIFICEIEGVAGGRSLLELKKVREGGAGLAASFEFVDEVLVHRVELEEKKRKVQELIKQVDDLNVTNEHLMRMKEMEHKEKVKKETAKYSGELLSEKEKLEKLSQEKTVLDSFFEDQKTNVDKQHESKLAAVESKYKLKLHSESTRQKLLKEEVVELKRRWNEENQALVESHQDYLREKTEDYEDRLKSEQSSQRRLHSEKENMQVEYDVVQSQTDVDGDIEIQEMKQRYEARLKQEEEAALALMSEHAVVKKNLQTLSKDADQQKDDIRKLKEKEARLLESIHSLEKDILSHKKEIREREETITDKEKRIFDLKKKNQELEKFRFVLDYKIKELKLQIVPRETEISTMRKQIEEMDMELEQYNKSNEALNLMIKELKLKLDGLNREYITQCERHTCSVRIISRFQRDLRDLWTTRTQLVTLKATVIALYRLYVQDDNPGGASGDNSAPSKGEDPQVVYNRDREQLERSLDALRRALKTDAKAHKNDMSKMVRENVVLTNQLNDLRKNYMQLKLQRKAIDESGVLSGKQNFTDILLYLGLKPPRQKDRQKTDSAPAGARPMSSANDGGGLVTSGEPAEQKRSNPSARSAALRTVSAGGIMDGQVSETISKADQWDAWREIQMQNDQMQQLEQQLRALCYAVNIEPTQMLNSIDKNLNALSMF